MSMGINFMFVCEEKRRFVRAYLCWSASDFPCERFFRFTDVMLMCSMQLHTNLVWVVGAGHTQTKQMHMTERSMGIAKELSDLIVYCRPVTFDADKGI